MRFFFNWIKGEGNETEKKSEIIRIYFNRDNKDSYKSIQRSEYNVEQICKK